MIEVGNVVVVDINGFDFICVDELMIFFVGLIGVNVQIFWFMSLGLSL